MAKIENTKKQVPSTKEVNEMDLINDIMQSEKDMSNNYNLTLGEMSNKTLFKKIFDLYKDAKNTAREAFDISFQNGWYSLEKAEETKISQAFTEANGQLKELG